MLLPHCHQTGTWEAMGVEDANCSLGIRYILLEDSSLTELDVGVGHREVGLEHPTGPSMATVHS